MLTDHRHIAWQFEIVISNSSEESRITADMRKFANSIRFGTDQADSSSFRGSHNLALTCKPVGVHLSARTEYTHYRFSLAGSSHILEITRARHYQYPLPGRGQPKVEITWEASMFATDWDNILQQQSTLGLGQTGDWDAKIRTFFPPADDGFPSREEDSFREFLSSIKRASELLASRGGKKRSA